MVLIQQPWSLLILFRVVMTLSLLVEYCLELMEKHTEEMWNGGNSDSGWIQSLSNQKVQRVGVSVRLIPRGSRWETEWEGIAGQS